MNRENIKSIVFDYNKLTDCVNTIFDNNEQYFIGIENISTPLDIIIYIKSKHSNIITKINQGDFVVNNNGIIKLQKVHLK